MQGDNPTIQVRNSGDLDHNNSEGAVNEQILILEVKPTALVNGLAMDCKKRQGKND